MSLKTIFNIDKKLDLLYEEILNLREENENLTVRILKLENKIKKDSLKKKK